MEVRVRSTVKSKYPFVAMTLLNASSNASWSIAPSNIFSHRASARR